ncbi:MAG: PhoU family transcriptional regulator [Sulfurimonas sp.]|nr:MAG: PhoU family transcriptional regulator [Sulfurimonas sp.]
MLTKYDVKMDSIREKISTLLNNILNANELSLLAFKENDDSKFKQVQQDLDKTGMHGDAIDNEIIQTFALFGPEAKELRFLVSYLKMTNEIVRIGEGVKKYARRMDEHCKSNCDLDPLKASIILLHKSTINALNYIVECFNENHTCNFENNYRKIIVEESMNDDLFSVLEKEIMTLIIDERELAIEYVKVLGSLRKLERACDRTVNIANLMMYAKEGGDINLFN